MNCETKKSQAAAKKMLIDCSPGACPVMASLSVIGGKWKPAILYALQMTGTLRFGELRRSVHGITQKMLTSQLRELENDGLVHRRVFAEVPPRVEYSLTDYGRTAQPVLQAMADWGMVHRGRGK